MGVRKTTVMGKKGREGSTHHIIHCTMYIVHTCTCSTSMYMYTHACTHTHEERTCDRISLDIHVQVRK